jgi:RHS repeat-associated protein
VAVSDAAGGEVGRVQYDPYGEVLTSTLPATLTDRLFTGQRLDSSSGLYYYNARYYDPHLGRFIQPDSLVPDPLNPQAWNRFSYVYNNPTSYVDPGGHFPWLLAIGVGVFALGGFGGHLAATSAGYEAGSPQWYASVGLGGAFAVGGFALGYFGFGGLALVVGITGDTFIDTAILGGPFWPSLARNAAFNIAFDVAGYAIGRAWRRLYPAIWGHPNARAADVTLEGFVERAFNGDWELYYRFIGELEEELPEGTSVVVRGSSVTGYKWTTGKPFDWLGPGTSDIDLVLIGERAMKEWLPSEFKIPGLYTANLGDATPHVAPRLNPLRLRLQAMVGRPINIQAASRAYMDVRHFIQGRPYLPLTMR